MAPNDFSDKENEKNKNSFYKDELSIKEVLAVFKIFKGIWKQALIYFLVPVIVLGFLGYLASSTSPREYDAKCVLITDQVASSGTGALQGLAGLAGINAPTSGGNESLGADLYPMVLSNKPFLIELSQQIIYAEDLKSKITLQHYFDRRKIKENIVSTFFGYIIHPARIKLIFRKEHPKTEATYVTDTVKMKDTLSSNFFFSNKAYISELTSENKKMIEILSSRIKFTQAGKLITLSVKMPEAKLSAEVTKIVLNQLIRYVTKFKTGKQLENIEFLEARTAESEVKYKQAPRYLAGFKDNNYHVIFEAVVPLIAHFQKLHGNYYL